MLRFGDAQIQLCLQFHYDVDLNFEFLDSPVDRSSLEQGSTEGNPKRNSEQNIEEIADLLGEIARGEPF